MQNYIRRLQQQQNVIFSMQILLLFARFGKNAFIELYILKHNILYENEILRHIFYSLITDEHFKYIFKMKYKKIG